MKNWDSQKKCYLRLIEILFSQFGCLLYLLLKYIYPVLKLSTFFAGTSAGKEFTCNAGDQFDSWVRKILWRRAWQFTPAYLPGESPWTEEPGGLRRWHQYWRTHLPMQEMWETWVRSLGQEDPLEEGMATHSSILAWRIPRTEEPGRLQSIESHRVRHDWRDLEHMPTPGWISKKKSLLSWNSHSFHTNKYIMECKVVSSFQTHLTMSCLRYFYCFL